MFGLTVPTAIKVNCVSSVKRMKLGATKIDK